MYDMYGERVFCKEFAERIEEEGGKGGKIILASSSDSCMYCTYEIKLSARRKRKMIQIPSYHHP